MSEKKVILSLGGSLVVPPSGIDTKFLSNFSSLVRRWVDKGYHFYIIVGGGTVCRQYQAAAVAVAGEMPMESLDLMGIEVTRMNAYLLKTILSDICDEELIDYETFTGNSKPVAVGGGWKPGCSTDFDTVTLAEKNQAPEIINMTNIDYVYDADPRTNPEAQPLKEISWADYRQMVGDIWQPGLNAPFDPIASKKAAALKLTVKILNGKNLENLEKCFQGEEFVGTTIR